MLPAQCPPPLIVNNHEIGVGHTQLRTRMKRLLDMMAKVSDHRRRCVMRISHKRPARWDFKSLHSDSGPWRHRLVERLFLSDVRVVTPGWLQDRQTSLRPRLIRLTLSGVVMLPSQNVEYITACVPRAWTPSPILPDCYSTISRDSSIQQ